MSWFRRASSEPAWKEEFSIYQAEERYVSRRQFTKFPAWPAVPVAGLGEIPVGGVKLFQYPAQGEPCILVRYGAEDYAAYSQTCTHLSCAVYKRRGGALVAVAVRRGAERV